MSKFYTETDLREMGMSEAQVQAILAVQKKELESVEELELLASPVKAQKADTSNIIKMNHNVNAHAPVGLVPTSIEQIASYKVGNVVELPPFGDGQPFVARLTRPSMLALVQDGKIPNELINQATSLFANGISALNEKGKNSTNVSDLFDIMNAVLDAALLEPKLEDIKSVGMNLSDDQIMAIFSYTQRGIEALKSFRTE